MAKYRKYNQPVPGKVKKAVRTRTGDREAAAQRREARKRRHGFLRAFGARWP